MPDMGGKNTHHDTGGSGGRYDLRYENPGYISPHALRRDATKRKRIVRDTSLNTETHRNQSSLGKKAMSWPRIADNHSHSP